MKILSIGFSGIFSKNAAGMLLLVDLSTLLVRDQVLWMNHGDLHNSTALNGFTGFSV